MTDLVPLYQVQQHDTAADQLRYRRAHLPERVLMSGIEGVLALLRAERAELDGQHDGLTARQAVLETELADCERKRADLDRKLSATSVPREAQTLSTEIDALVVRQSGVEDELLEILEALDPLDARLGELAGEIAAHEERATVARAALAAAETEVDSELTNEMTARAAAAAVVADGLLGRYEALRTRLGGVAVAALDRNRCTGCNLTLSTAELEAVLAAPPDELVTCDQCGRLLVR